MGVHSKWFYNGDCLIRRVLPPAKERGTKVNVPLDSAPLSLKACYFGPLVTNILSFCLKIVVLTYLDKVFKTQSLWAKINMSHQPVDDVKGTIFASSDLVLDRI